MPISSQAGFRSLIRSQSLERTPGSQQELTDAALDSAVKVSTASQAEPYPTLKAIPRHLQSVPLGVTSSTANKPDAVIRQIVQGGVADAQETFRSEPLSAKEMSRVLIQLMPRVQTYVEELVHARLQERFSSATEPATNGAAANEVFCNRTQASADQINPPNDSGNLRSLSEDTEKWISLNRRDPCPTEDTGVHPSEWKGPPRQRLEEK